MFAEKMCPLSRASDHLFRNVLQVGERFAVPIGRDGRESLIVSLHQTICSEGEGIAAAELPIQSNRTFPHARVVDLDRRAVVSEFGVEAATHEDSAFFSEPMTGGKINRRILRVGGGV